MATIPRFLLPRRGPMWQQQRTFATQLSATPTRPLPPNQLATRQTWRQEALACCVQQVRSASTRQGKSSSHANPPKQPAAATAPAASNTLEKPAKFNPPSHGSRLPRRGGNSAAPSSQHYGGDLSAAELAAQRTRQYPGMMAPPGTWAHWFWNNRMLHMILTMSTLTGLALFTFFENFRRSSPYVDLLPTGSEAASHPIDAVRTFIEVVRLTEHQRVTEITERRQQRIDDVAKRTQYRKAHGMDETVGFGSNGGWFSGSKNKGPTAPVRNEETSTALIDDASPVRGAVQEAAVEPEKEDKRKKILGIF